MPDERQMNTIETGDLKKTIFDGFFEVKKVLESARRDFNPEDAAKLAAQLAVVQEAAPKLIEALNSVANSDKGDAEKAPRLFEGLSIDAIRNAIQLQQNVNIPPDDPVLCFVPMLNAFLLQEEENNKKHREALAKFMNEFSKDVLQKHSAEITESLKTITAKGLKETAKDIAAMRTTFFLCSAITFVSALLIVGAVVWRSL